MQNDMWIIKRRDQHRNGTQVYYSNFNLKMLCEAQKRLSEWYKSKTFFHERTWECHHSMAKYKKTINIESNESCWDVESLFDGFADVAVTGSDARHQDLLSSFAFVFSRLLWFDLEHDLKEVSDVSQELDPTVENVQLEDGGNSTRTKSTCWLSLP